MRLRNSDGMTLMEVMVALGAVGILLMTPMSVMQLVDQTRMQSQMYHEVISAQTEIKAMLRDPNACLSVLNNSSLDASGKIILKPEEFTSDAVIAAFPSLAPLKTGSAESIQLTGAELRRPAGFGSVGLMDLSFTKNSTTLKRSIPIILTETAGVVSACEAYSPQISDNKCPTTIVPQPATKYDCHLEGDVAAWSILNGPINDPTIEQQIDAVANKLADAIDRRRLDVEAGRYSSAPQIEPGGQRKIDGPQNLVLNSKDTALPPRASYYSPGRGTAKTFFTSTLDVTIEVGDEDLDVYTTGKAFVKEGRSGNGALIVASEATGDFRKSTILAKTVSSDSTAGYFSWGSRPDDDKQACIIADDITVLDVPHRGTVISSHAGTLRGDGQGGADKVTVLVDHIDLIDNIRKGQVIAKTILEIRGNIPKYVVATESIQKIAMNDEHDTNHRTVVRSPLVETVDLRNGDPNGMGILINADRINLLQLDLGRRGGLILAFFAPATTGNTVVIDRLEVNIYSGSTTAFESPRFEGMVGSLEVIQFNEAVFPNQDFFDKFKASFPKATFNNVTFQP